MNLPGSELRTGAALSLGMMSNEYKPVRGDSVRKGRGRVVRGLVRVVSPLTRREYSTTGKDQDTTFYHYALTVLNLTQKLAV
jgi:hypothetical protein